MKNNKWGFLLTELQGDYVALKFDEDGNEAVKLVVNKKFLKKCKNPLKIVRLLELIFKEFLKQAQEEKQ